MSKRFAITALVGTSLLVSACGHKATGQTVAVVNGEEITASELNAELSAANVPASAEKQKVQRLLLQNIINRRLLAQRAVAQGIDKSPEFLERQRRDRESLLIGMSTQRQADSAKLPDTPAVDSYIGSHPTMFAQRVVLDLDQLQFTPPANPAALVAGFKEDHTLEAIAKRLTAAGIPFARSKAKLDTVTLPPDLVTRILMLPAGEPFLVPAQGKLFANVVAGKTPVTLDAENQRKIALQLMRREGAQRGLQEQVKELRGAAKIDYQQGYAPTPEEAAAASGGTPPKPVAAPAK